MFLTDEERDELTGIRRGKKQLTKHAAQAEQLRKMGIPFYLNARGKPIVTREALIGQQKTQADRPRWEPKVLHMR